MKALMFALLLVLSVSVYAKNTEGGINVPGVRAHKIKQTWQRAIANTDGSANNDVFDQLDKLNKPTVPTVTTTVDVPGFASSEGALTKPASKAQKAPASSAAPSETTASK